MRRLGTPPGSAGVLIAILAAAFNLRIGIVAIGPVIDEVRADTSMSSGLAGVLTTIPFLCMGAFAFLGPPMAQRLGAARVVITALALIAAGSAGRSLATEAWAVLAATLPIGLGIALIGVTLPSVVKERFPAHGGTVTGAYVASLSLGITIVGFGLVPLVTLLGGWREALLVTGIPALAAIVPWMTKTPRMAGATARDRSRLQTDHRTVLEGESLAGRPSMRPTRASLLLGLVFGLQSLSFAGMVSWAPAVYEQAGWSHGAAALTTSSVGVYTIVSSLIFPPLSEGHDRRLWIAVIAVLMGIGVLGVGLMTTSGAWVWLTMFGLGTGAVFPLMLALPLDLHDSPVAVADTTAWMMGIGYLLAALAPVTVGALRDATGDFVLAMSLLGTLAVAAGLVVLLVPARRTPAAAAAIEPS